MSLGNYEILNPSRTFRLSLIFFFPSLSTAFHLTNLEKRSYKWMANGWLWKKKEKTLIIKTGSTFRYLLLCFSIVFSGHFRSLNETRFQQSWERLQHLLLHYKSSFLQEHQWLGQKLAGEWNLSDVVSGHKIFGAADSCFSTQGMTNICQLLSIRSVAPVPASLALSCPSEVTRGVRSSLPRSWNLIYNILTS